MDDLKPCPFCGSRSIFYDRWYAMHCFSCGAQGPDADDLANEAAAAAWNRRTNKQLVLAIKALRLAENEMRYAGWFEPQSDNVGQEPAYAAVVAALSTTDNKEQ